MAGALKNDSDTGIADTLDSVRGAIGNAIDPYLSAMADTVNPYIGALGLSMKNNFRDWTGANHDTLVNIPSLAGFASPADYHDPITAASKNAQATIGWLPGGLHSNMPPDASPQMAGTTRLISPPSASPPLPDNVMATFAGTISKTADYDKLATAQDMHAAGSSPDETRQATGWFLHPADNQWRYEIPDNKARLTALGKFYRDNPDKAQEATLGQLWSHGDLYQAYPSLQDLPVHSLDKLDFPNTAGAYSPSYNAMGINYGAHGMFDPLENTLVHEPQHWVQNYEGFAAGASPQDLLSPVEQQALRRHGALQVLNGPTQMSPELQTALDRATAEYRNTAGEIEARQVEQRRRMNPLQRSRVSPLRENQ